VLGKRRNFLSRSVRQSVGFSLSLSRQHSKRTEVGLSSDSRASLDKAKKTKTTREKEQKTREKKKRFTSLSSQRIHAKKKRQQEKESTHV
jgi:hypothetical protein